MIFHFCLKNEKFLAWKIYSIVTDFFTPNPIRLRDWISSPRSTGYEALHITVVGPKKRWVEVQIRSERMNEIAEKGYAAHYKYKQVGDSDGSLDLWLNKIQETLINNNSNNAVDFVEEFKLNLYSEEIFVFTPAGELKSLPKNATSLDFAFSIHTEIGLKTRGVKVNGKLVPLNSKLKSGDRVEILTSDKTKPNANWLDYANTARAKNKIKSSLNDEKKKLAEEGKEILVIQKIGNNPFLSSYNGNGAVHTVQNIVIIDGYFYLYGSLHLDGQPTYYDAFLLVLDVNGTIVDSKMYDFGFLEQIDGVYMVDGILMLHISQHDDIDRDIFFYKTY